MNINKYWIILESLHFPVIGATEVLSLEDTRWKTNLKTLQTFIKLTPEDIINEIIKDEGLQHLDRKQHKIMENSNDFFAYSLYSLKILLTILRNVNFSSCVKEDLVSEKHKLLLISSIREVAIFGLQENLHSSFYKEKRAIFNKICQNKVNLFRLQFMVDTFYSFMSSRDLNVGKSLHDVHLLYMASIFSLIIATDANEYILEQSDIVNLHTKLQKMWIADSKKLYYRNLMLLFSSLPITHRQKVHREMLVRLWSPGGFVALLFAIVESQRNEEQSLEETVSNIVGQPNFSNKAQESLIKQILVFLETSLKNKDISKFIGAALLSLRKLYDNKKENKENLKNWIEKKLVPLMKVEESQIIAMEWCTFADLISLLFHIFCSSSIATLPSELLVPYLPLLLDLYRQLECHASQRTIMNNMESLILKVLNNRSKEELKIIIKCISLNSYPKEWFQLSYNIQIRENSLNMQELKLSVVDREVLPLLEGNKLPLSSLVVILKKSSYNLLVYEHFLILLQLVPSLISDRNSLTTNDTNIDLLTTEEDICNKIMNVSLVYANKIEIVKSLEILIQHQPLKTFINQNTQDLLNVLKDILRAYTDFLCHDNCQSDVNSPVLTLLIILIREFTENSFLNSEDLQASLLEPLNILESQIQNEGIKYQLKCLVKVLKGEESFKDKSSCISRSSFEEARSLMESHQSYLQVQGIEMMIKLIKERDIFTVTNGHMLTALALNTLKSKESYTFLNCIRLLVALINVNETEILNILSDEYLNESVAMDHRLIIGEAILKISKELGPLCYRYKDIFLNIYMAGCRSHLDEFRFSAFSNLSQMCRQLTYQVHHYFQELLNLIECELTTGKYVPAKRAAVMVLSDLLDGMDNLFDFGEMLLPIYRLLKHLVVSEKNDDVLRIHASLGLKCLSEKCKELLSAGLEQHRQHSTPLEKEIKIFGVRDKLSKKLKSHILEIN